jgi:hypothetical protein
VTRLLLLLATLLFALASPLHDARADDVLEFYPSYYPHEIRIEAIDPASAAKLLAKNSLHAYVGGNPFAGGAVPPGLGHVESLGSYLVATFHTARGAMADRDARCASAGKLASSLAAAQGAYVFHPYPVTPFHMDYLHHFDLSESAKRRYDPRPGPSGSSLALKIRANGALAKQLVPSALRETGPGWDVTVEEIAIDDLVAPHRVGLNGWLGPPWIKEGWFQAYLLHAGTLRQKVAKQAAEALYRRLATGAYGDEAERFNVERRLVSLLREGCERVVVGYTTRREYFNNSDYSEGLENIAHDSQAGFASPIFIRTVKLKDFLWNGWLRLGVGAKPRAAWNPLGGFTDAPGRLIWAAVGDPGQFPAPYNSSWVPNRVTSTVAANELEVPTDALLPEPGTGLLRPVGEATRARAKVLYRVLASPFHDKVPMTVADALYPFSFASRTHDPRVAASTRLVREWLAGVKVLRVEQDIKDLHDKQLTFQVLIIEVYLTHTLADPRQVAAVAPPWSSLPWQLIVLMEEAVKRGLGALSQEEARRQGVPWLDLVRDQKVKDGLAALVEEFRRQGYVPAPLRGFVTPAEARARWTALKQFYEKRRHFLVTNGPYQLEQWGRDFVALQAFREFTYPVGLGLFNRYAMPRRAYVSRIERRGERLEIRAEVERVFKFQRSFTLVREPLAGPASDTGGGEIPVARYVVVGEDGNVLTAGTASYDRVGLFSVDLRGKLKPGPHTIMVALSLGENSVNPEVKVVQ